ncbi:MAG: lytic murein transglycosylase [Candidatus Thiocaldithrix dubininis]|jgi:membrane-bound lytic murein transglycosylase B|uniref:Lytic murein transglycosylase n=1 Tax=Candidatus Thiocaldithrix dubininis TaxID=3080823 RepID=A0AA95KLB4_9GAMM|nr:MAG: lytic murein transglycosylase [Candidatus Thiocaldithrix dubininis]
MRVAWVKPARTVALLLLLMFSYSVMVDSDFEVWKAQFRQIAIAQGIQPSVVDLALRGLLPDQKVLEMNQHQPEFSKPVWDYLGTAVSDKRVAMGQQRWRDNAELLQQIYQRYGVQPQYVLAIWGVESDFGNYMGRHNVIRSLATLTYKGNLERRAFWEKQLIAALRIVQKGDIPLVAMRGSWAGALGHTQFIPTTFEEYAVDFDGDGKRNLVGSIPDALASTANYLAQAGWKTGQSWGEPVQLPTHFDWSKSDPNYWLTNAEWLQAEAVKPTQSDPLAADAISFVLLPAGYRGPAFLVFQNFQVILKYNNAQTYALAVGYLGDRLAGAPAWQATWPTQDKLLSTTNKAELQELLTAAGYSTDGIDGRLGPNTRAALRRWQMDNGLPADGYATYEQLETLRQTARSTASAPLGIMQN